MYTKEVAEELASVISGSQVIEIENAAHMIQIEQPKILVKHIHALK